MSSSDRQPEGLSVEDFDGKQAELIGKLSEISTSMRQCADIFDSFTRIVRQFSIRPITHEATGHRQPSGPALSRGSGSAPPERSDPRPSSEHIESVGSPSFALGIEGYRRPSQPHTGSMLPPAVPTYHGTGLLALSSSSTSTHAVPGPSSYLLRRPSSSASGTGSGGLHEVGSAGHHVVEAISSERHVSTIKQGKRKRSQPEEVDELGEDSEVDIGMDDSPRAETHEGTSETELATRRSTRHPVETPEESLGARVFSPRGYAAAESGRSEDRPVEPTTGPSIVVFSSGAGSSKSRALQSRTLAQTSSGRSRKEKKPRDPNAPKQPPPAYIVYQNEIRETMRARFPTLSPTELVKEIAATWKTLPNAERQRYKDRANLEKDRWVAQLAAYQATLSTSDETQPGRSSEGSFLAMAAVSDSPPVSPPRRSPSVSDTEADPRAVRRVVSQDMSGGSASYYHAPLRAISTHSGFMGPGVSNIPEGSESRSGRSTTKQEYPGRGQEQPLGPERSLSRSSFTSTSGLYGHAVPMPLPSPPAGRSHFSGHMEPHASSTRLPSFKSLGLGHSLQPGAREPSPGPMRGRSETEGEPALKRQRTMTDPPAEEEEAGGSGRSTHEGRDAE